MGTAAFVVQQGALTNLSSNIFSFVGGKDLEKIGGASLQALRRLKQE